MTRNLSLLFFMFQALLISAQIGINTDTPNQALDINGKVKIGNDGRTPTNGTVRYSPSNQDFEGFSEGNWKSLTKKSSGSLPSNPIPITSWVPNVSPGSGVICTFNNWDGVSYQTVPNGKKFVITGIYPTANASSIANNYYSLYFLAYQGSSSISYSRIRINSYDNETRYINGDQAPLMVLNEGQYLQAFSYNSSEINMAVSIRGFMVDDLNY